MKTLKEMLAEARAVIPEQGPAEVKKRLDAGEPVVADRRARPDEYRDGFIEPATNISRGFLEFRIGRCRRGADHADRAVLPDRAALHAGGQGAHGPRLHQRDQSPGRLPEVGPVRPARW